MRWTLAAFLFLLASSFSLVHAAENVNPSSSALPKRQNISAETYFNPIGPNENRPAERLQSLEMEPKIMSADDFKEELGSQPWRVQFECDGRPMKTSDLAKMNKRDGYGTSNSQITFDGNHYKGVAVPTQSSVEAYQKSGGSPDDAPGTYPEADGTFTAKARSDGAFRLEFSHRYSRALYKAMTLKASGETVIQVDEEIGNPGSQKDAECAPGKKVQLILVPVPST
jgi:hypothetical protein